MASSVPKELVFRNSCRLVNCTPFLDTNVAPMTLLIFYFLLPFPFWPAHSPVGKVQVDVFPINNIVQTAAR